MSLIAGMDNVVEYIKKLEEENKKLREERFCEANNFMRLKDNFDKLIYGDKDDCPYEFDDKLTPIENKWKSWDYRIQEIKKLKRDCDKEDENLELRQQNRMKDDMMKNMILSLVATPSDDFEYEIKDDYSVKYNRQYNKDVEEYFEKIVKEMNDTDWNEDNNAISLVYEDYNISVLFNDTDEDTSDDE